MNSLLIPLLILAAQADRPTADYESHADVIFACDFEESTDSNFDQWPDDWTRRRGRGYPFYLPIEIVEDRSGEPADRCLEIRLDGGAARAYSPRIAVSPLYSYVLRAAIKTESLTQNVASCTVTFLNDKFEKLESYDSGGIRDNGSWKTVVIGPVTPRDPAAKWARVELSLEPTGERDLVGAARFDDLWLGRLPRMSIETNSPFNIFANSADIEINCRVSGFSAATSLLKIELRDIDGRTVAQRELPLRREVHTPNRQPGSELENDPESSGVATWNNPVLPGSGFYTVLASLSGQSGAMISRSVTLAVIDPEPLREWGDFGWSLPNADEEH